MEHAPWPLLDVQRQQTRRLARGVLAYAAVFGAAVFLWLRGAGAGEGVAGALVCSVPAAAAAWALFSGLSPVRNAIAKLLAVGMMGPLLLLFWAGEQAPAEVPAALFVVPAVLVHAAVFVTTIVLLGKMMTRVDPVADAPPASTAQLHRRLVSFAALAQPACTLQQGAHGTLLFELHAPHAEQRHHRVLLDLQHDTREVRVREQLAASAAAPATADEASLRGPGDAAFDPARPDAGLVWHSVRQTTVLEPELLEAVALHFEGDEVRGVLPSSRGEGLLTALCAVVTRSGWAWQPVWRE